MCKKMAWMAELGNYFPPVLEILLSPSLNARRTLNAGVGPGKGNGHGEGPGTEFF